MRVDRLLGWGISAITALGASAPAWAEEVYGQPRPWQLGLQPGVTSLKQGIGDFHNLLLIIITLITIFVLALLVYVMFKFSAKNNPVPSKTSHNTLVEVAWTVVPIMILVVIAVPSFKILYDQERIPEKVDLTFKATGYQWYWGYEYPDQKVAFESRLVEEKDLKAGELRLLTVDNPVVVPVNATVRVLVTASDVVHAWTVPAFGVKKDAYPGRINQLWFKAERIGTYYGQCSELCGTLHGYMPIMVKVVSQEDFAKWMDEAKKKFASEDAGEPKRLAAVRD